MKVRADVNPILDEGAPTSVGGMVEEAMLSNFMGMKVMVEPPRERYHHGWGQDCAEAKPVVCTWTILVMKINDRPTLLHFCPIEGVSLLMIGLDVKIRSETVKR